MRILVISDSHGDFLSIKKAIESQNDARDIFFLGDVLYDIEKAKALYPDKTFYAVKGNCDTASAPLYDIATVNGVRIFYCHGHKFGVKYIREDLALTAKENNCVLALYGHTHVPETTYMHGVTVVNPGSCALPRGGSKKSYAVIDIEKNGIMPIIIEI